MTASDRGAIRIGTRGSPLARTQTGHVVAALSAAHPGVKFELVIIRTSGDRALRDVVGAFVKELQEALLCGAVDLAVHSFKDLPTERPDGLTIGAVPVRQDPRDAVLSPHGTFAMLPQGSRVGTGSARRAAQLRNLRPDLRFLPLVGNVDTRLRKLREGDYEAIVAALAGLRRLDLPISDGVLADTGMTVDLLEIDGFLPAPGQGALAIECRSDDAYALDLIQPLDDPPSHVAVRAERAFLARLGGGCQTPVAAYATVEGDVLRLRGLVAAIDGATIVRGELTGATARPEALGDALADRLAREGALALLQGAPA